jgi:hypothetical protein
VGIVKQLDFILMLLDTSPASIYCHVLRSCYTADCHARDDALSLFDTQQHAALR